MPKEIKQLIADYLSGNIGQADAAELVRVLREDEKAEQLFRNMAEVRALSSSMKFEEEKDRNFEKLLTKIEPHQSKKRIIPFSLYKAAAVLLLLITSNSLLYKFLQSGNDKEEVVYYETSVPYGSLSKVMLPDNTCVWLNAGSSLKYAQDFGKNKRREVYLKGEAYFKVSKDANRPFFVHSGKLNIRVLGTTFNVRAYSNEQVAKVGLIEGKVNVEVSDGQKSKQMVLKPNEQIAYNKATSEICKNEINAEKSSWWITGKLCFIDDSFATIATALERKYDVRIANGSDKLKNERFSGSFDVNCNIDEILSDIDVDHKYTWTRVRNVITIKDKN